MWPNRLFCLDPFADFPLPDDNIAMASALRSMDLCVESGVSSYSLTDGCHDQAVGLAMYEAARTGAETELAGESCMQPLGG